MHTLTKTAWEIKAPDKNKGRIFLSHCGLALYKRPVKTPLPRKDVIKWERSNGRGRGRECAF
jgi:hypothetical protein